MRRSRSLFILLLASATAASLIGVPACAGLKLANTSGDDAGTRVDGAPTDATSPGDAEVNADGGPVRPLDDTACDGANKWSAESKSDAKCIGRKVRLLESWSGGDGAFGSTSTSIVRAVNGRTGVAVHRIQGVEEGELRIFAMSNTAEGFAVPPPFRITGSQFEDFGVGVHLRRGSNDDFHIVYQRVDESSGGPILYRKLLATGTLTAEESVAVVPKGALPSLAVSPKNDDAVISYFVKPSQIASRFRTAAGTFKPEVTVASVVVGSAPGVGESAPMYDLSGQAHVAYTSASGALSSSPKYVQSDGQFWTIASQTIDNSASAGIFGLSIGFAIFGTTKHLAYFARPVGNAATELRVATWDGAGTFPNLETVLRNIPIPDPELTPVNLDLAVDRFGALHLVAVLPANGGKCKVAYLRQVPVGQGLNWIQDTVDEGMCSGGNDVRASIVVDDAVRAHIAYSMIGAGVFYATRYDRQ